MDLTIIIVNWNGADLLRDCLASIAATQGQLQLQVIVVDNASRDGSREAAAREFPQFTVLNSGANLGYGKGNNFARPFAIAPLVLFLNPDTRLLPGSLDLMLRLMRERPDVAMLGPKMRSPEGEIHALGWQSFLTPWMVFCYFIFGDSPIRRWFDRSSPPPDPLRSGYVTKLYGGCLLCRKLVLDEVDWFDERYFMYAEDGDLCQTLLNRGWKLYYAADAEIIHIAGGTSEKAPSGFSILMKQTSVAKMMHKYNGASAVLRFRLATALGASFRLVVLLCLRCAACFHPSAKIPRLQAAMFKHRLLLLWSLGLKHASPPP